MTRAINSVAVFGLGKVGELVASLLKSSGFAVTGFDSHSGVHRDPETVALDIETSILDVNNSGQLRAAVESADAVVSCLPYALNSSVAESAYEAGRHYFDLTEDVPTTNQIMAMTKSGADSAFAPQCGLAPGLVGIIGADIARRFEIIRSIELKVGALPKNPTGMLGYAFNWSAEGVVNEYLNDCEVVRSGQRQLLPAMSEIERVVIGGVQLEAALTSGGLGTMCRTYEGRVQRLDYKTLRYPDHFRTMKFLFDELHLRSRRSLIGEILVEAKPPVNDDVVYLHVAVEGVKDGIPFRENHVRGYEPIDIDGRSWRAISWTTAASVVAVVQLVAEGQLPQTGFIRQEDIPLDAFLSTQAGSRFQNSAL